MVRVPRLLCGHDLGIERRGDHAPFGGRVGMRHAAAEGAAGADRMVRDVAHDRGQELAQAAPRTPARRTPHAARRRRSRACRSSTAMRVAAPSTPLMSTRWVGRASRNAMIGTRLCPPASTRPSSRRHLRQRRDRLVERLGRVIAKGGGFIDAGSFRGALARARNPSSQTGSWIPGSRFSAPGTTASGPRRPVPYLGLLLFFGLRHGFPAM